MTVSFRPRLISGTVAVVMIGFLAGCTSVSGPAEASTDPAAPQRIAAISPDVAETVAALGAGDRLVLVPDTQTRPALTNHLPVMQSVGTTFAAHGAADPEQILATDPDLAIITPRHEGESDTAALLEASSVPVLTLPNSWRTVEEMLANITTIGTAIGASEQATVLTADIERDLADIAPVSGPGPSVLVLSNQAGRPMINAGNGFTLDLLARAGGRNAADSTGLTRTGFADPEHLVRARPDAILLVDLLGAGRESFDSILSNPAVSELEAVRTDRILVLDGKHAQALGLQTTTEGVERIRDWLADLDRP
ncbi:ABC transporter substrate-binding protein [Rhodococcus sp. NPDC060090]|uniref:ABC transporter substrate-binding protein n=1 Tax=Rhodococcus sp. NPDC060090 TaxID=3347056 RepID=UPI003668883E